jgi:hypothetical protein
MAAKRRRRHVTTTASLTSLANHSITYIIPELRGSAGQSSSWGRDSIAYVLGGIRYESTGCGSVLESRGDLDVCEAVNGMEAIEKTRDLNPDLVILDISMPLLDGFSAARGN